MEFKFLLKSNTLFYDLLLLLGTGSNVTSSTASQSTTFSAWTSDSSLKTESFYLAEHKKPHSRNLVNCFHRIFSCFLRFLYYKYRFLTKVLTYKKMKPSCQNRISQIQIWSTHHRLNRYIWTNFSIMKTSCSIINSKGAFTYLWRQIFG